MTDSGAIIAETERVSAPNYAPLPGRRQPRRRRLGMGRGRAQVPRLHQRVLVAEPRAPASAHRRRARRAGGASHVDVACRAQRSDGRVPRELCALAGLDMALPMNTGAEAVETAIKLARKWGYRVKGVAQDRAEIVVCRNNFHGRTTTIVGFSSEEQYREDFGPFTPGFTSIDFGDLGALRAAITPNTVAFLVEPIQAEAGIIVPPTGISPPRARFAASGACYSCSTRFRRVGAHGQDVRARARAGRRSRHARPRQGARRGRLSSVGRPREPRDHDAASPRRPRQHVRRQPTRRRRRTHGAAMCWSTSGSPSARPRKASICSSNCARCRHRASRDPRPRPAPRRRDRCSRRIGACVLRAARRTRRAREGHARAGHSTCAAADRRNAPSSIGSSSSSRPCCADAAVTDRTISSRSGSKA